MFVARAGEDGALELAGDEVVRRRIEDEPVALALEGQGKVRCQSIVDVLPSSTLATGDFTFAAQVAVDKNGGVERGEVRLSVDLSVEDE